VLKSPTAYEVLERSVLQPRLAAVSARHRNQRRATTHGGSGIRCDRQGLRVRPPTLYQQRGHAAPSNRDRVNLLGEYDFSEERLQDTVGIKPPKLVD